MLMNRKRCFAKDLRSERKLAASKQPTNFTSQKMEPVDESQHGEPIVEIRALRKIYNSSSKTNINVAVKNLSLKMYRDQVFCLLGHNGVFQNCIGVWF